MRIVRIALLVATCLGTPAAASALTIAEILQLAAAGLEDDVLIALIEVSEVPVPAPADLIALKAAGVSKAVMLSLVRASASPRQEAPDGLAVPDAAPAPGRTHVTPHTVTMQFVAPGLYLPYPFVPYPVIVAPGTAGPRGPARPFMEGSGFGRFINDGWRPPATPRP